MKRLTVCEISRLMTALILCRVRVLALARPRLGMTLLGFIAIAYYGRKLRLGQFFPFTKRLLRLSIDTLGLPGVARGEMENDQFSRRRRAPKQTSLPCGQMMTLGRL